MNVAASLDRSRWKRESMSETILVTGATCPTGELVVRELVRRPEVRVRCLVRKTSKAALLEDAGVLLCTGDLVTGEGLKDAMSGVDTVIHVAGVRFVRPILQGMRDCGVHRGVFVNTTGVFSKFKSASELYQTLEAEMRTSLTSLGADYVAIRPTMIYGDARDRNICRFFRYFNRHRLFPMFGDGSALIQPVYFHDVASAILSAYEALGIHRGFYNISGESAVTYRQLLTEIARLCGHRPVFVHLPLKLTAGTISTVRRVYPRFPLKGEQVWRTTENRDFDHSDAQRDLDFRPLSIEEGLRLEAEALGVLQESSSR